MHIFSVNRILMLFRLEWVNIWMWTFVIDDIEYKGRIAAKATRRGARANAITYDTGETGVCALIAWMRVFLKRKKKFYFELTKIVCDEFFLVFISNTLAHSKLHGLFFIWMKTDFQRNSSLVVINFVAIIFETGSTSRTRSRCHSQECSTETKNHTRRPKLWKFLFACWSYWWVFKKI